MPNFIANQLLQKKYTVTVPKFYHFQEQINLSKTNFLNQ